MDPLRALRFRHRLIPGLRPLPALTAVRGPLSFDWKRLALDPRVKKVLTWKKRSRGGIIDRRRRKSGDHSAEGLRDWARPRRVAQACPSRARGLATASRGSEAQWRPDHEKPDDDGAAADD
eukprot:146551-Pyramimonas_sp.AAC.1